MASKDIFQKTIKLQNYYIENTKHTEKYDGSNFIFIAWKFIFIAFIMIPEAEYLINVEGPRSPGMCSVINIKFFFRNVTEAFI